MEGLDPSDLNQGELGNCWFVAACSALALEKKLWDKVVPNVKEQVRCRPRTLLLGRYVCMCACVCTCVCMCVSRPESFKLYHHLLPNSRDVEP